MSDDLERQLRERLQRAVLPSAPFSLRLAVDSIVQTVPQPTVRRDRRRIIGLLAVAAAVTLGGLVLVTGGGLPPTETALQPSTIPSSLPLASASASPGPSATPAPTGATPASATVPVSGSARELSDHAVLTAPGPDGGLFVVIPARAAPAVLALFDSTGSPRAGWPIELAGATSCDQLLPVDDGSVRVICTLENPEGNLFNPIGAFAFDAQGRSLAGWPVALDGFDFSGRLVGDELTLLALRPLGDVIEEGQPVAEAVLVTVSADGTLTSGAREPRAQTCCGESWAVGPDGAAYGVVPATTDPSPQARLSAITALELAGVRPGWPVEIDGTASGPAFGPLGRAVLAVGDVDRNSSRIVVLDRAGGAVSASSPELPIQTVEFTGDTGSCVVGVPPAPVVAQDGTTFLYSELDSAIFALDPALAIMGGWPFEPGAPLVHPRPGLESEHEAGYCPAPVPPAVGPDDTLYLSLDARNSKVGGSLVAVGPDGKVVAGWPVELTRPGAEFWSVVAGPDGTVYAVAFEPEAGGTSSASVLAIAPDSTVLWTTTIIEP